MMKTKGNWIIDFILFFLLCGIMYYVSTLAFKSRIIAIIIAIIIGILFFIIKTVIVEYYIFFIKMSVATEDFSHIIGFYHSQRGERMSAPDYIYYKQKKMYIDLSYMKKKKYCLKWNISDKEYDCLRGSSYHYRSFAYCSTILIFREDMNLFNSKRDLMLSFCEEHTNVYNNLERHYIDYIDNMVFFEKKENK